MKLKKKLETWVNAGLINEETSLKIQNYEKNTGTPLFLYAVSGIGAFSIFLGLVSVIAANWDGLSPGVKLSLDGLLGALLCGGLSVKGEHLPRWSKEILIAIISGWTLASIALIGQVYQLGGQERHAILYWSILTIPLLLQGRSFLSGGLLLTTLSTTFIIWGEYLASMHLLVMVPGLTLGILALSTDKWIVDHRPELSSVFTASAAITILGAVSVSSMNFYYGGFNHTEAHYTYLFESILWALPGAVVLWRPVIGRSTIERYVLIASVIGFYLPLLNPKNGLDLLGIIWFIAYWGLIAKAALDCAKPQLFRFATFVVAARLVIMYFELVGSLLNTGVLFISGGLVMLLICRVWYQKQGEMVERYSEGGLTDEE